tara:strand:+ start:776 stop:1693 length:918 start_codon:yes stop_codon:yes gene_type:complete
MKLDLELKFLRKWLKDKTDPPFFSDLKLKKLGFTFVGSNVYRYALILNILKKYKSLDIQEKCIDFGSYPGQLQEIIFTFLKIKFDLSGLHFDKSFKDHFSHYRIFDFDFEKTIPNDFEESKEIYSLATSFNTIEHMEYPNKLLDNINYFTKIGGHLILTTDNISTLKNIRRMILGGKSPNESLVKSKLFYHGEWRAHVRILSKDELFFLLNHSGFKVIEHVNFNLRAREYSIINNKLVRKKLSFKAKILETIENLFPIYRDHHLIVAKKVVNFDDLDSLRMKPTNSTDEWISYRYKKFEIFDRTK